MARKLRVEIEGGLYHVISRGNDRQDVFHSHDDFLKFLSLLADRKSKTAFYLYAYCLMTNHIHLLLERQAVTVGNIMQRVLTGYSQYYNRKYKHVGHVFQGRHKSILCESDRYLTELIRYIHLNPVRARMVNLAEEYPYSSQRAYLGMEPSGIVDVDSVLRHFGPKKELARERFREFVGAGAHLEYPEEFDSPAESRFLGSEEFVDDTIHRIGSIDDRDFRNAKIEKPKFDADALLAAVETIFGVLRESFCGSNKTTKAVMAKAVFIITGRDAGATITELSVIVGLDTSTVSRRYDAAKQDLVTDSKIAYATELVKNEYLARIAKLQA